MAYLRECEATPPEERERIAREREEESRRLMREKYRQQDMRRMFALSGLGEKFLKRTFETFEVSDENRKHYEHFYHYAKNFASQKKGFYLWGGFGTGKTHLAAAVANHLLHEGKQVLFLPVTALKERVYASYRDHSTAEIIAKVCGSALLILDDFDKLNPTDGMKELMYGIVNRLYEQERQLIITANVNRPRLAEIYDGSIASRIAEMCICVEMSGRDRRVPVDGGAV
jgi:DNA replication protein DnaC